MKWASKPLLSALALCVFSERSISCFAFSPVAAFHHGDSRSRVTLECDVLGCPICQL